MIEDNFDTFRTSKGIDSLKTKTQIRVFICTVLDKWKKPVEKDIFDQMIIETGIVNYFEYNSALYELEKTSSVKITADEDDALHIELDDAGKEISDAFSRTIREDFISRSLEAIKRLELEKRYESQTEVRSEQLPDGQYRLTMKIVVSGVEYLCVSLLIPTKQRADEFTKRFRKNPHELYRSVLASLTDEVV
ncbi:MAG: DUF4364 family protein [Clostridia bacterium]|nr:DUF4364 family protein [Clostridia bacterium]